MEDDEGTISNVNKPLSQEVEGLTMEDKPLETEKLMNTETCDFVPETVPRLDDSQLGAAESPIVAKEGEAVVEEEETPLVDIKVAVEEGAISGGGMSVPELHDLQVVGAEPPIIAKDDKDEKAVVEEESPVADTKMVMEVEESETGAEMQTAEGGGWEYVPELHGSQLVAVESRVKAKDDNDDEGAVEEEDIPTADMKMEIDTKMDAEAEVEVTKGDRRDAKAEVEVTKGDTRDAEAEVEVTKGDTGVAEAEMTKCDTGDVEAEAEVAKGDAWEAEVEGEVVKGDTEDTEAEVEVEVVSGNTGEAEAEAEAEAELAKGDTGDYVVELVDVEKGDGEPVVELQDSPVGAESLVAAKDDEDDKAVLDTTFDMETDSEREVEVEAAKGGGGGSVPEVDGSQLAAFVPSIVAEDDKEEAVEAVEAEEEETPTADTEMETEVDVVERGKGFGGKRKRGKNSKVPARAPARKTMEEDVCFICFDGGDLVLCDRRGCPKAYHPSCVNRDEAFFRAKGRWNCGWHLCSNCEKNAYYMCYTCTFSLCKGCIRDAVILCVRGNKGFCETCMKTVMLIENNEQVNKEAPVDFDDRSSWEYLFKDYWIDLKAKLSLSMIELSQAKNPWKGSDAFADKLESPEENFDPNVDGGSGSEKSSEDLEASKSKRRKAKKRLKSFTKEEDFTVSTVAVGAEGTSIPRNNEWASKDLLEFVMHMKNGDKSALSQFDVQALLLEYIKRNKLRDPRRKSQIICDSRLENLFGKARVGHFEMLKLLEAHFLIKEDSQMDDIQGSVVDTEVNQMDADGNTDTLMKGGKDKKRKTRKRGDGRGPQSNLDDYAAIDIHNINLIYLRRKLMEDLLEDVEKFHDKVVGTFVRIRISGTNQKQDIYRLVQVVGTSKAAEPYKIGKRTTDIVLEILNLNKTEVISIDTISNQEFTEDECKRLRQSIKCGLINRLTVGDILDKAMEVQAARVNDWLETEIVRLSHLRDRASEKGRRKELRECVEKLQLLKTPEERRRRLEEVPEIHSDPKMDPSYESEENDSEMDDNKQEVYMRPRGSGFSRIGREPISPGRGDFSSKDSWSGAGKSSSKNWELSRNLSNKNFLNKSEDATLIGEILNENSWSQAREKDRQLPNKLERPSTATDSENVGRNNHSAERSGSFSGVASETSPASLSAEVAETAVKINETEKMWHYRDPSEKNQGPFSIVQLRKWSNTGYFPVDLRIWRSIEKQNESILLTDALAGRFPKASSLHSPNVSSSHAGKSYETPIQPGKEGLDRDRVNFDENRGSQSLHSNLVPSSQSDPSSSRGWTSSTPVEVPKISTGRWVSDHSSGSDSLNLPSPTPKQHTAGWTGGEAGPLMSASSFPGDTGTPQSPPAANPDGGQLNHSSTLSSTNSNGSKEHSMVGSLGFVVPTSATNSGQGIFVGPSNSIQTSQLTVTGESHGVQIHSHVLPASDHSQPVNSQIPPAETHSWGNAPSQKLEPSLIPVHGQPMAYGHWVGVTSNIQNSAGNFSSPGVSALPQPDPWRPAIPSNQSNMQPPSNIAWVTGVAENNSSAPVSRSDNPNTGWGTMPGNPNMGWGGPAPGTTNMSWGATVQGPSPGNANPGWVVAAGNPGATALGPGPGPVPGNVNPGWVAPNGNPGAIVHGMVPGNANPGWATPTGAMGATVQGPLPGNGNPGWVAPTGNPGATSQGPAPGNANQGWGAPAGNQGTWGSEQHDNGDRFSGQRDRGSHNGDSSFGGSRPWNRQLSFGGGGPGNSSRPLPRRGQRVCKFHENGHCKKGAACDYLHT